MRHVSKRAVGLMLSFILLLTALPSAVMASDYDNHWAKTQIESLIGKGVVLPDAGTGNVEPGRMITRAEVAGLINRMFGLTEKADISAFTDVPENAADDIAKAVKAGFLGGYGNGTILPDGLITRQEMAKMATAFLKVDANTTKASALTDAAQVSEWAKGYVGAALTAGIMNGYPDGSFKPLGNITRAEAFIAVSNMAGFAKDMTYVGADETFGSDEAATTVVNMMITGAGAVVKNTVVTGDLTITAAVGEGEVTLEGVEVKGTTYVRGGGANSVKIGDGRHVKSKHQNMVVLKINVTVKLESGEIAEISYMVTGKLVVSENGTVELVLVNTPGGVTLTGEIQEVRIETQNANLNLSDAVVNLLGVAEGADGSKINSDANSAINDAIVNAVSNFLGAGSITNMEVNSSGVTAQTLPENTSGDGKVTQPPAPTVGSGGQNVIRNENSGGGGSSGGSSSAPSSDASMISMKVAGVEFRPSPYDPLSPLQGSLANPYAAFVTIHDSLAKGAYFELNLAKGATAKYGKLSAPMPESIKMPYKGKFAYNLYDGDAFGFEVTSENGKTKLYYVALITVTPDKIASVTVKAGSETGLPAVWRFGIVEPFGVGGTIKVNNKTYTYVAANPGTREFTGADAIEQSASLAAVLNFDMPDFDVQANASAIDFVQIRAGRGKQPTVTSGTAATAGHVLSEGAYPTVNDINLALGDCSADYDYYTGFLFSPYTDYNDFNTALGDCRTNAKTVILDINRDDPSYAQRTITFNKNYLTDGFTSDAEVIAFFNKALGSRVAIATLDDFQGTDMYILITSALVGDGSSVEIFDDPGALFPLAISIPGGAVPSGPGNVQTLELEVDGGYTLIITFDGDYSGKDAFKTKAEFLSFVNEQILPSFLPSAFSPAVVSFAGNRLKITSGTAGQNSSVAIVTDDLNLFGAMPPVPVQGTGSGSVTAVFEFQTYFPPTTGVYKITVFEPFVVGDSIIIGQFPSFGGQIIREEIYECVASGAQGRQFTVQSTAAKTALAIAVLARSDFLDYNITVSGAEITFTQKEPGDHDINAGYIPPFSPPPAP